MAPGVLSEQTSISVRKSGPTSKMVGETAEFTITVTNTGSRTLTNLNVVDSYDPSLSPVQAAEGYRFENNDLVWTIESLEPGKTAPLLGVHCRCLSAAAKACNRVAVIAEDGSKFEDEACLAIRETSAGLGMTVADLRDPVKVGQDFTYEIRVSNAAPTADQQVAVVVTLPTGMMPVELGTSGPGKRTLSGQTVRFDPVAEIRPNETLTYRVRALPQSPGELTIHVELTSQNQPQPITVEESTKVFQ